MRKILMKRALAMLTAAVLLLAFTGAAYASDTQGLPCEAAVAALYDAGVAGGYPDGSFRPDAPVTIAEAAKFLTAALGLDAENAAAGAHWAAGYIAAAAEAGLLADGAGDEPDRALTPDEAVDCLLGVPAVDAHELAEFYAGAFDAAGGDGVSRGLFAEALHAVMTLPLGGFSGGEFVPDGDGATYYDMRLAENILAVGDALRSFALAAYYEDDAINAVKLIEEPAAYLYSDERGAFIAGEASADSIVYNFAAVYDTDGDELGDAIFIVPFGDAGELWDETAALIDPRAQEDEAYAGTYEQEYSIPYGERLLGFRDEDGFFDWGSGAVDYYNTVNPGDLDASTYYPTYDWYNSTSTETLTMLTGFKTIQQSTGWACGVTSAIMAMEWYGMRDGLSDLDLGALRDKKNTDGDYVWGGATDTQMLINVFTHLNEIYGDVWTWESTYDYIGDDGELDESYLTPDWIVERLAGGMPVLVGWNSFGGHWQVIIGYDDMGTETWADDVLILADPYDSTDHRNDGVNIQSFERLYYDWTQNFDRDFGLDEGYGMPVVFVPVPAGYDAESYEPVMGDGLAALVGDVWARGGNFTDDMLIPYGDTAGDLAAMDYPYTNAYKGENGLAGPASDEYYRAADFDGTPYYPSFDFYEGSAVSDTLIMLEGFKTSQQASEWTCGPSSLRMVLEWYGAADGLSEFDLAAMRSNDIEGATTLFGMINIMEALNGETDEWYWLITDNLDDDLSIWGYYLESGSVEDGLIPWLISQGIPVIIGWDEWGGHWQVIIGYDDMGTQATQDDVLILADPYDTTDHCQDGYVIESFERLVYGWGAAFDESGGYTFIVPIPGEIAATLLAD